jgi:hypothetical protein
MKPVPMIPSQLTERARDQAEYELTEAVYRLIGRGPSIPQRG